MALCGKKSRFRFATSCRCNNCEEKVGVGRHKVDESTSAVISDDDTDTLALRNKAAMELGEVMVVAANKYCWDNELNGS